MKCFFPKTIFILGLLALVFSTDLSAQGADFPKSDTVVCDTFPPPRNLDGLTFDHTVKLWWEVPILIDTLTSDTSFIDNLLCFKLVRNGIIIDTVYHTGEDTIEYYDILENPLPYDINYYVTALYDLSPCGYPGILGESIPTGTFSIMGPSCHYLPFIEDWNTNSFTCNSWYVHENWIINGQYGNPFPCAEYTSNLNDTNYHYPLTSWWLDCLYCWCYDTCIDGDYYLEFDFELSANQASETEFLTIEYTDSLDWFVIEDIPNSALNIPWTHKKLNITEWVKGKYVSIAFVAKGENSSKINSWSIDNINVYRMCHPPRNLYWSIIDEEIRWTSPIPHTPTKNYTRKGLQGYHIFHTDSLVGFTTDTVYTFLSTPDYGPYYVTAVYEDCEPSSNSIYGPAEVEEINKEPELKIYPNPCHDQFTIESNEVISQVHLINSAGDIVFTGVVEDELISINTSSLSSGIYLLKITLKQSTQLKKLIIIH